MDLDLRLQEMNEDKYQTDTTTSQFAIKRLIQEVLDEVCRPATDKLSDSIQEHEVILVHNVKLRRKKLGL